MTNESKRNVMIKMFSDYHKDAFGIRPRWDYSILSLEELEDYFDTFGKVVESSIIRQNRIKDEATISFNKLVEDTTVICSCDKTDAIRYLMDAENLDIQYSQDRGYFCWLYKIKEQYFEDSVKEMTT